MRDVDFLIIHHIGAMPAGFPVEDPVPTVRSWHQARGWSDIGYHKVVTPSGAIKQGRADTVVGAHAFGANGPSLGILVVGDFRTKAPGTAQRKALVNALATLCKRHGVPVSHIIGHRDVPRLFPGGAASDCPGDALYAQLPSIRREVEAYL
jgi:hypothetical protein